MNFTKTPVVVCLGMAMLVMGCTNRDQISSGVSYDHLYFDYSITGEEGNEHVTCVFQYKYGDEEGKAINIEPAKVELDGQTVETDSAKLSGFFYEIQKPVDSFSGKHVIVFKTPDDRKYTNEFEFSPFAIEKELPEKVKRKPFTIRLKNFPSKERSVRLLLLDTAFESSGFNDLVPVVDGKVTIDEYVLAGLMNGPVILELYLEREIALKQKTNAGGRISITYGLKREFELAD